METERTPHLTDLAASKPRSLSGWGLGAFIGAAAGVVALFAGAGAVVQTLTAWQAESFGDRRLLKPSAAECQIARALVRDHRDRDLAGLLRSVGAGEEKMALRAFAWRSSGARVPPGMDWRNCRGLGAAVRRMGLQTMGTGDDGPALYISRAQMNAAGDAAVVRETFRAPREVPGQPVMKAWTVELSRGADGGWRLIRRSDAPLPDNDFRKE